MAAKRDALKRAWPASVNVERVENLRAAARPWRPRWRAPRAGDQRNEVKALPAVCAFLMRLLP